MNQDGVYDWAYFRDKLVEAINADESNEGHASYYQRWVRALEQLALGPRPRFLSRVGCKNRNLRFGRERRTLIRTYGAKSTLGTEYVEIDAPRHLNEPELGRYA